MNKLFGFAVFATFGIAVGLAGRSVWRDHGGQLKGSGQRLLSSAKSTTTLLRNKLTRKDSSNLEVVS